MREKPWTLTSKTNLLYERVQDQFQKIDWRLQLSYSLSQDKEENKYTRYFSCWCAKKVGGMPFIKRSRNIRVRKP